ncbi:MAG: CarD family transcriptional regulator [Clostridium butyricum]|nr:CarD family transcriptional regulator [Clostridium butyricum]
MFKINDYIMYGMTGVCKVTDIKEEKFIGDTKKECYVLRPIYSKNTIIKTPVDNKRVVMRKLHSKEEAISLINGMPEKETLWIDDERERTDKFKVMLKTGECEELITLIKSIYCNKKNKKLLGKKISKSDDEIMKAAENLLNEEFATILGISPDEVTSYILNHISQ